MHRNTKEGGIQFGCRGDRLRNVVVAKRIIGAKARDLGEEVDLLKHLTDGEVTWRGLVDTRLHIRPPSPVLDVVIIRHHPVTEKQHPRMVTVDRVGVGVSRLNRLPQVQNAAAFVLSDQVGVQIIRGAKYNPHGNALRRFPSLKLRSVCRTRWVNQGARGVTDALDDTDMVIRRQKGLHRYFPLEVIFPGEHRQVAIAAEHIGSIGRHARSGGRGGDDGGDRGGDRGGGRGSDNGDGSSGSDSGIKSR